MRTSTKSVVTHTTHISPDSRQSDGGRSLLIEAFDLIREEKQVGRLTVDFGLGGSISTMMFDEKETIAQRDIAFGLDATNGTAH